MRIPVSIEPNRIKDAIVEINFGSNTPMELNLGVFYNALESSFSYSKVDIQSQNYGTGNKTVSLFYNDKIKFQINNNIIAFNCLEIYTSWLDYFEEIKKTLKLMHETRLITKYVRLGIRYVSEYDEIDLKDCSNFSFSFGLPDITSDIYTFNTEFKFEDFTVALNLNNKIPVIALNQNLNKTVIGIDVIKENLSLELDAIIYLIDRAHTVEKEIFFKLLNKRFLEQLNPQY